MDNTTAINMLKMRKLGLLIPDDVYEFVINSLEKLEQYQTIGTVEECREARERQMAKKRKLESYCGFNSYECPVCCADVNHEYNFCPNCGQRLE